MGVLPPRVRGAGRSGRGRARRSLRRMRHRELFQLRDFGQGRRSDGYVQGVLWGAETLCRLGSRVRRGRCLSQSVWVRPRCSGRRRPIGMRGFCAGRHADDVRRFQSVHAGQPGHLHSTVASRPPSARGRPQVHAFVPEPMKTRRMTVAAPPKLTCAMRAPRLELQPRLRRRKCCQRPSNGGRRER